MNKMMSRCGKFRKIFFYGTLKCGQPNHKFLNDVSLGHCKFVAEGMTTTEYPLLIATRWNLPFLLDMPGVGKTIQGEVYEADDHFCEWLDDFENLYIKKEIIVKLIGLPSQSRPEINLIDHQSPAQLVSCFVYCLANYPSKLLDLPLYANYDCYADHKRVYNPTDDDSTPETLMEALVKEAEK